MTINSTTDDLIAEIEAEFQNAFDKGLTAYVDPKEGLALFARLRELEEAQRWIPVTERLPDPGVTVMVYSPPRPEDRPGDYRIEFDGICPESDGDYWVAHGEQYEHWCCIAKGGDGIAWHGPSEKAPYTHWKLAEPPA